MTRRAVYGLLTPVLAAVAVTTASLPASADPAAGPVGIGVARTVDTQRGLLRVPAWTDDAGATVTAVTATVRDGAQTVTSATLGADPQSGYWVLPAPLELVEDGGVMPHLGRYAVDVTATDTDGNSTTRTDAGTLDFTLRPTWLTTKDALGYDQALTFTPPVIDRTNRSTSVTGTLLGVQPGSGDLVPVAGHDVRVTSEPSDGSGPETAETVPTDAQGVFTSTAAELSKRMTYTATVTADDDVVHGATSAGSGGPGIQVTPVHVTASVDRTTALPGQFVTISGVVRTGTATSSPVVANAGVTVQAGPYGNGPSATVRTDANGHFSGKVVAVSGDYVTWSATPDDIFLSGAAASGSLVVPAEASYAGVSIRLGADGRVTAHATLDRTYVPGQALAPQVTRLEYSPDGQTGWRNVAAVTADYGGPTLSGWGYVSGYYRLHHPTSPELADTATTPVRLSRLLTRVYGNNAAPEPVHKNAYLTVRGSLQEYRAGWHALGNRTVELYFRATGAKTYSHVATARADRSGHVVVRAKATRTGAWLLQYFGDAGHFDSDAVADTVIVR